MTDTKNADCFNFVRLVAAFLILGGHMYIIAGQAEPVIGSFSFTGIGVALFFSLSGYLVTQSWISDPHVVHFAIRRFLRVFPTLAVVSALSVVALGPLLGTLAPTDYFNRNDTWLYLQNIALLPDYYLPGVFESAPMAGVVNGSLWTLPIGMLMYLTLMILGTTRLLNSPTSVFVFATALCAGTIYYGRHYPEPLRLGPLELHQVLTFAPYFWVSVVICLFRPRLEFTLARSVAIMAITLALVGSRYLTAWSWVAIPYITISFATQSDRLFRVPWQIGDLSYGIYLYAFPVQQTLWHFFHPRLPLSQILALSALVSTLLAWATWELVEYPALRLKPRLHAKRLSANQSAGGGQP